MSTILVALGQVPARIFGYRCVLDFVNERDQNVSQNMFRKENESNSVLLCPLPYLLSRGVGLGKAPEAKLKT